MIVSEARVAHLYYEEGLTQQEIASRLGVSRIRVSRMLQAARNNGVVTISIRYDGYWKDAEHAFAKKYGLARVIVCDPLSGSSEDIKLSLGRAAAEYLTDLPPSVRTIAVGWGTTMRAICKGVRRPAKHERTFVPLIGGHDAESMDIHASMIAHDLAASLGGRSLTLTAPAIAHSREELHALLARPETAEVLRTAASADAAIFGIGEPTLVTSTINTVNYFLRKDIELLKSQGAACDLVSMRYLNRKSEPCAVELAERAIGVGGDRLIRIPQRICVAGGAEKAAALHLALVHGAVTDLITDLNTAMTLTRKEYRNET